MKSRDYRRELIGMIDRLLCGDWSVDDFRRAYYFFWVNEVPSGLLSEDEEEFFSGIQEQLDWTAPEPSPDEKHYGWLTEAEYIDWVKLQRMRFGY